MSGDEYVTDENGTWNYPSSALEWYRAEVKRLRGLVAPEHRLPPPTQPKTGYSFDEIMEQARNL